MNKIYFEILKLALVKKKGHKVKGMNTNEVRREKHLTRDNIQL